MKIVFNQRRLFFSHFFSKRNLKRHSSSMSGRNSSYRMPMTSTTVTREQRWKSYDVAFDQWNQIKNLTPEKMQDKNTQTSKGKIPSSVNRNSLVRGLEKSYLGYLRVSCLAS